MQKVNVVCVGKIKESFFREAVAEYAKRLSRFVAFSVREICRGKGILKTRRTTSSARQRDI